MNTPDLRDYDPNSSQAKNVEQTNMLDTEAHETPETVKATNTNKEEVTTHPTFGPLGSVGRAG